MKLIERTRHSGNDFDGILQCEHCGSHQYMQYGYDDLTFHHKVVPAIKCMACDKRTNDMLHEGISDPGYQGGTPVRKVHKVIEVWEPKL